MSLEYRFENRGTVQVRPTGSDKRGPCWYILASTVLLGLIVAAWLFFSGYLTPVGSDGAPAMSLRGKLDEQEKLLEKQAATLHDLEEQLASARREQQVQVVANEELDKKLSVATTELATARENLVLYEGILSPSGLDQGLHIQHFGIRKRLVDTEGNKTDGQQELYRYHLVLAHIRGGDVTLEGSYTINLTGKQDGKTVTVTQKDLTPPHEEPVTTFAVKHYQSLEGNLQLPKDFKPESVKIKVSPASGEAPERLAKSYDWETFKDTKDPANNAPLSKE